MLLKFTAPVLFVLVATGQTLDEAKRAFDSERYADAARLFDKARRQSTACEIPFYLGLARYRLHQVDAALIAFQEAAKCNPKLTLAYVALGEAYAERGNDAEALPAFEHALSMEPENRSALRGASAIYLRMKLNDKAVAALETLVKLDPADAQTHADLGAAYFGASNQDAAEKQFDEALKLNPKSAAALLGSANVLMRKGEEEHAIQVLRRVIVLSPKAFQPRFVLGSAYNHLGRFAEAETELKAALRLGAVESEVYYQLARTEGGLGRVEEKKLALAKFAELRQRALTDTDVRRQANQLMEQAKVDLGAGDLPGASGRMKQANELCPHDETILFRLASLAYDLENYKEARDSVQEAIGLAPSQWLYHFLLGLVEGRAGRLEQARASLDVAVRLNPAAADAHNALGEVYLRQGESIAAAASFQKALELDPGQTAYRANLEIARKAVAK